MPGFSDRTFSRRLRERMARLAGARFHVPAGCLYKFCDHISDVTDGNRRHRLAHQIATDVESSIGHALKRKYGSSTDYRVHIWTKNVQLKAHEPDREPEPL